MGSMEKLDVEPYLSAWKKRIESEKEEERKRAEKAFGVALETTKVLVQEGRARRVYLFGSLALFVKAKRNFTATSDIDLAVEGVPKKEYFRILADINRDSDFEIDLVDLADCPSFLKETILKNGVLLYDEERGDSFACQ